MRRQSTYFTARGSSGKRDGDLQQQAERDAHLRPIQRREDRRHHHRRAEAREAAHHTGNDRDGGRSQEGNCQDFGHLAGAR